MWILSLFYEYKNLFIHSKAERASFSLAVLSLQLRGALRKSPVTSGSFRESIVQNMQVEWPYLIP
jgi:hypothetical protein